jgi:7-cyano-7-deazaguanine reductase
MHPETPPEANLTLLGRKVPVPTEVDSAILEPIPNRWVDADYEVNLFCEEFTSLCPVTNQPDFGKIIIVYRPDRWLVESKSLKLYLGAFRNTGSFAEYIVNRVLQDLVKILQPKHIEVRGEFTARGGIRIVPVARWSQCGVR